MTQQARIDSIQWISHRGLSQQYDENSLASFKLAAQSGFNTLEVDLRSSKDNHIVLCHDSKLSRIANHPGLVEHKTRAELASIVLRQGESLLFLDEFMLEFAHYNWVFDIKPESALQTIQSLKVILQDNKELLKKITFLFWREQDQNAFLKYFPEALCFARIGECFRAGFSVLFGLAVFGHIQKNKIYALTPKLLGLPLLNKRLVKIFHKHNAQVLGYLPETQKETQQCIDSGVDFILSNHRPP